MDVIREKPREIPVVADVDVCVVGGSCTGVFAAIAAARLGAKVAIIELNGFFGGVATASLVNVWHSPMDIHDKQQVIAGLTLEVIERLGKRDRSSTRCSSRPSSGTGGWSRRSLRTRRDVGRSARSSSSMPQAMPTW